MKKIDSEELKIKIELLEKLLSKNELCRSSITERLSRIREQLDILITTN